MKRAEAEAEREPPPPGAEAGAAARRAIDDALLALARITAPVDLSGVKDRLTHAIACIYAALDSHLFAPAHHDGLREAGKMVKEAHAVLAAEDEQAAITDALGALNVASSALTLGVEAVARAQIAGGRVASAPPPPQPFRASFGIPQLHALPRKPMVPEIEPDPEAPEPPPPPLALRRPETFEELADFAEKAASGALAARLMDEPEPPPVPDAVEVLLAYEPAVEDAEVLRRLSRDCLEDIAIHRELRKPNPIESWLDQAPFEQRLLDNLDCFACLGSSGLPLVSIYFAEAPAPDPGRAFAVAFVLGCIAGRDSVDAAIWTLKQAAPETHPGWVEGFALASNPEIDTALAGLTTSPWAGVALAALIERRTASIEDLRSLARSDDRELKLLALRGLGLLGERDEAIAVLSEVYDSDDDAVFLTAVEAAMRRGDREAQRVARRAVDDDARPERANGAALLMCLGGAEADHELLAARARRAPTVELARGLGRFGHAAMFPVLLELLETDAAEGAAEALERMTGAGLWETVEESWEIALPPEAAEAGGLPIPTRKVQKVIADPTVWREWLRAEKKRFPPGERWRAGRPFHGSMLLDELESKETPPERRPEVELELSIATGLTGLLRTDDWVARQRTVLASLREALQSRPVGGWSYGATPDVAPAGADPLRSTLAMSLSDLPAFGVALPGFVAKSGETRATAPDDPTTLPFRRAAPLAPAVAPPPPRPPLASPPAVPTPPPVPKKREETADLSPLSATLDSPQAPADPLNATLDGPVGRARPALPFAPSTAPSPRPVPPRSPSSVPALPFDEPPAPKVRIKDEDPLNATADLDAVSPLYRASEDTRDAGGPATKASPLPFPATQTPKRSTAPQPPGSEDLALPFKRKSSMEPAAPRLSLDSYASLEAELMLPTADAPTVLTRYGIDRAGLDQERRAWQQRFAEAPAAAREYQTKLRAFHDWLTRSS
ncbi:MAG: hypothetical protein R3B72_50310 [Polyangiaceae bacterium]